MNKSKVINFVNGKPSFARTCRYCNAAEITLTYEMVGLDNEGSPRWRYVPRTLSGSIHNCYARAYQPDVETLKKEWLDDEQDGGARQKERQEA